MLMRGFLTLLCCLLASHAYAFPDNGVLDAFTGCTDTTTPPNSNWTNAVIVGGLSSTLDCEDQAVTTTTAGTSGDAYYNVATFNANQEAYATMVEVTQGTSWTVFTRLVNIGANTTDGYFVNAIDGSGTIDLARLDNGAITILHQYTQATAIGDKIGLRSVGTTHCLWFWDASGAAVWVELGCETDATYTAGGRIGMNMNSASGAIGMLDDFGGGNVAAASILQSSPVPMFLFE